MLDLLTIPRTRVAYANRMTLMGRRMGYGPFVMQHIMLAAHAQAYGDPTEPRAEWQHKGPRLAEMFRPYRMRQIPRELRRIYAPYP